MSETTETKTLVKPENRTQWVNELEKATSIPAILGLLNMGFKLVFGIPGNPYDELREQIFLYFGIVLGTKDSIAPDNRSKIEIREMAWKALCRDVFKKLECGHSDYKFLKRDKRFLLMFIDFHFDVDSLKERSNIPSSIPTHLDEQYREFRRKIIHALESCVVRDESPDVYNKLFKKEERVYVLKAVTLFKVVDENLEYLLQHDVVIQTLQRIAFSQEISIYPPKERNSTLSPSPTKRKPESLGEVITFGSRDRSKMPVRLCAEVCLCMKIRRYYISKEERRRRREKEAEKLRKQLERLGQ